MKKFPRLFFAFLCLGVLLPSIMFFSIHIKQAHASTGTPQLYNDNPYDLPYYDHATTFVGENFSPSSIVKLSWTYAPRGTVVAGKIQTDTQGGFTFVVQHMPSIPYNTQATLSAVDSNGLQASSITGENIFINATPAFGTQGSTVHMYGGGYGSSEPVDIYFDGEANPPLVATVTTNTVGVFKATFHIPHGVSLGGSNLALEARGTISGADSNASFDVIPGIHASTDHGPSGTAVTIKGRYFTATGQVLIEWYDPTTDTMTQLGALSATATGTFKITVLTPANLTAGVQYLLEANDVSGQGATVYFTAQN
jgi:hypothetical protein